MTLKHIPEMLGLQHGNSDNLCLASQHRLHQLSRRSPSEKVELLEWDKGTERQDMF